MLWNDKTDVPTWLSSTPYVTNCTGTVCKVSLKCAITASKHPLSLLLRSRLHTALPTCHRWSVIQETYIFQHRHRHHHHNYLAWCLQPPCVLRVASKPSNFCLYFHLGMTNGENCLFSSSLDATCLLPRQSINITAGRKDVLGLLMARFFLLQAPRSRLWCCGTYIHTYVLHYILQLCILMLS